MCGRYAFFSAHQAITQLFGVPMAAPFKPRYNICPTQFVPVVRTNDAGSRELAQLYWGLIPFWAKEKSIGSRMINARAETVAEKPAFRAAFRQRRCVILADGYYEWQAVAGGKQPYFIHARDRQPFAMAGLWESWRERAGAEGVLESCAIITTAATPSVANVHDRMPQILSGAALAAWLDAGTKVDSLGELLSTPVTTKLAYHPVSRRVNSPRNDGPELIEPLSDQPSDKARD
ncbi:MAG: SOS response-associated peptidase [Steroidobacteraceae bacterium]